MSEQTGSEIEFEEDSQEESKTPDSTTTQDSESPPSKGNQSPFDSGPLAGKTPEEIEEEIRIARATIRSQGQALNRLTEERNRVPAESPSTQTPIKEVDPAEYFQNPMKHNIEATRQILKEELKQLIQPFEADRIANQKERNFELATETYPNIPKFRKLVEAVLAQSNIPNPTQAHIEWAYLTARGIAAEQGIDLEDQNRQPAGQPNGGRESMSEQYRNAPPQHRASSQPLRDLRPAQPKVRELTEDERRYARLHNLNDREFIELLDMDPEDVVEWNPESERKRS